MAFVNVSGSNGAVVDLFIFAHQDDEYGAFELLTRTRAEGRTAVCVYLTNGDFGGQPVEPRNAESRAVLACFGVAHEHIHFLGGQASIGDGQLYRHATSAYAKLLALMRAQGAIGRVYVPAWEGGHQDHDVAHAAGILAAHELGLLAQTFQFSLYNGHALPGPLFRVMTPLHANGESIRLPITPGRRLRYVRLSLAYPTQWKTWVGLFPFVLMHYIVKGVQVIQPVSLVRLRERPDDGSLLYERRGVLGFDRVRVAVDALVAQRGSASEPVAGP